MNKKRAALRRGIRNLIADTTKDLAAFEGREPVPHRASEPSSPEGTRRRPQVPARGDAPPPPRDDIELPNGDLRPAAMPTEILPLNGSPVSPAGEYVESPSGDRGAAATPDGAEAAIEPAAERAAAPVVPFELATETVYFPPAFPPAGPLATGEPRGGERDGRPTTRSASPRDATLGPAKPAPASPPKTRRPRDETKAADSRRGGGARGGRRGPRGARTEGRKAAKQRKAPVPGGLLKANENHRKGLQDPPRRTPDDVGADTARGPAQAESRTGVCRSYFINHECWRVPTAYCNTALQVCVIRRCPVYHLHKDALERRFAKKFKHLW